MPIEWMPRSRHEEDGWRDVCATRRADVPFLDGVGERQGVRIPILVHRYLPELLRRMRALSAINALRLAVFALVMLPWSVTALLGVLAAAWWTPPLLVVVVLFLAYRAMRLHRFGPDHGSDLLLTTTALHAGVLVVPWEQVVDVVRFNFLLGPGPGGPGPRNYLALRIGDFVGVRGLSPFRAGLANLTRRRLLVLAMTVELHDPEALAGALSRLADDPHARRLLADDEGLQLVLRGGR